MHYSRVPRFYWRDRLQKMHEGGLTAVQIYVPWNFHNLKENVYEFEGDQDLIGFLKTAQNIGLDVIMRAGPYICGEWDFGGLPPWLLKRNASLAIRSNDPEYMNEVTKWWDVLLPKIKPMLYENGGPILMVQVENEYGSWPACDHDYIRNLTALARKHLGETVVLYTTDGNAESYVKCGTIKGLLYATVDFGPASDYKAAFQAQVDWNPGPLVNSEFYTGWLDHWGDAFQRKDKKTVADGVDAMLKLGANVNMYMYEGGTNFGFWNGANYGPYLEVITSYDYDAPLNEAGDLTPKYYAVRDAIKKYRDVPPITMSNTTKFAYGSVRLIPAGGVLDISQQLKAKDINSIYPLSQEEMGQAFGFTAYMTKLQKDYSSTTLDVPGVRDRAHVLLDGNLLGILFREKKLSISPFTGKTGSTLVILVENMARIGFGEKMIGERKGIISNATINKEIIKNWQISMIDFAKVSDFKPNLSYQPFNDASTFRPTLFSGKIQLPNSMKEPADTYLDMGKFNRGIVLVNNVNIGRYWQPKGPQKTLYVPANILKAAPDVNIIHVFEVDGAPCGKGENCTIEFIDHQIWSTPARSITITPIIHVTQFMKKNLVFIIPAATVALILIIALAYAINSRKKRRSVKRYSQISANFDDSDEDMVSLVTDDVAT